MHPVGTGGEKAQHGGKRVVKTGVLETWSLLEIGYKVYLNHFKDSEPGSTPLRGYLSVILLHPGQVPENPLMYSL